MNAGIDIGYSHVKSLSGNRRATFPSVSGTPDTARFSLNGNDNIILNTPDGTWMIGHGAVEQSRFLARLEDRKWILSDEYYRLMLAAFTELTTATGPELRIVTGLPVAFYIEDKPLLQQRFLGDHTVNRKGRSSQRIRVADCRVIPQPFGAVLNEALNNRGVIVDLDLAGGTVGVIDIGGKTTNLLSINRLAEVSKETISINLGAWDIVRAIRDHLSTHYPDRDLRDHQIIEAVINREMKYYGKPVDLTAAVNDTLQPMARQIIAQATQLWNGGAGLDAILVSGGGAHLFGGAIKSHFRHARIVDNPVYANVSGYWKLAQRVGAK